MAKIAKGRKADIRGKARLAEEALHLCRPGMREELERNVTSEMRVAREVNGAAAAAAKKL